MILKDFSLTEMLSKKNLLVPIRDKSGILLIILIVWDLGLTISGDSKITVTAVCLYCICFGIV